MKKSVPKTNKAPARKRAAKKNPRVLIVTPEITYLPPGMGNMAQCLKVKAGGLADVSASLVSALYDLGADVHVALPHYRRLFHIDVAKFINDELRVYKSKLNTSRIHLAEDREFYYRDAVYGNSEYDNPRIALAFQREVINNIVPIVKPDLIHCNDWMTGLIPAMARRMGIPCLFTIHNIHTCEMSLAAIEDKGIDAAEFWRYLFLKRIPYNYEESRNNNLVDFQASGIFASHFINTVSPTFLEEIVNGRHAFIPGNIKNEMSQKNQAGCALGILNSPDPSYNPATDKMITAKYTPDTSAEGKIKNKRMLQDKLGLKKDDNAPIFFWPSRLDPMQKGCTLLSDILYRIVSKYWDDNLQVAIIASGSHQGAFRHIAGFHGIQDRVAVWDFSEQMSRLGFAGSDFTLVPSLFEPCGLPQMIGGIYGSLPIAHDTGGLHDTVKHIDARNGTGNGFIFKTYDANGLFWAIDQAMEFHKLPNHIRVMERKRIMEESLATFNHSVTAKQYIDIYESMLKRPLVNPF